jgi:hypothetical protein
MGFLSKLFGRGDADAAAPADSAWHFYVKSNFADEIVDLRVDPRHDLLEEFDGEGDAVSGYSASKDIIGAKSFRMIALRLVFDRDRRYTGDYTIEGGELVDQATYEAWKAKEESTNIGDTDVDGE